MSGSSTYLDTRPQPLRAAGSLAVREVVRFLRQRNRVIGALGQPILFWLLFGAGLHGSFQLEGRPDVSFSEYYLPGTVVLILLFTAIFATISIIEDRREGFLQGVLVAPAPRWSMVLGKVLGGSLLAVGQAVLFLLLSVLIGVRLGPLQCLGLLALLSLAAVALTSFGFVLAWRMESTQGFHAIMNLLLMPMWLLSGAFFPAPPADVAGFGQQLIHWIIRLNPVSYSVAGIRHLMSPEVVAADAWSPSPVTSWCVTLGFAVVSFTAACWIAQRRSRAEGKP